MQITSLSNPRVKAAARLRDRRGRDEQGRIIIDGVREIGLALAAGVEIVELFFFSQLCHDDAHQAILQRAGQWRAELIEVSPTVMEKLAYGNRVEGIVAVAMAPRRTLTELTLPAEALVAVVEGVEKPGNLGAIVRTADAAGVAAVIVASGITDLFNPNAIRASLGAIFTVPVCAATADETQAWLRLRNCRIYAARVDGAIEYSAADFRGPSAIVLGSEAAGLSNIWHGDDVVGIKLPMLGQTDSLNLSATAAVLFYEALRQRQPRPDS
ncbi:MAG: RNA methyltransferase [Planctomycetaceae bacterium]|nr:RNA methyltransferase [Planctomycetaceae bacterium]